MSRRIAPEEDPRVEQVLDLAEEALDRGDAAAALELADGVLSDNAQHAGALFITAEAFRDLRYLEQAEHRYRQVLRVTHDHSPSWSSLGAVLFDQLRFDEAIEPLHRAIRLDLENPEAYYWRGMLRERRGDLSGADRDFRKAFRLDPWSYPRPVRLDDAMVEAVVEEALTALHPTIRDYLVQCAILLHEVPDEDTCMQFQPPAPPGELLGFFSGVPLTERSLHSPWSNLPSAIVLFRRNLERYAWDRDHLIEELRITVFHEVGHFLGLSEEDLDERGLG